MKLNEDLNTAKLVAFSQPVDTDFTPEDFIAFCARVSNPANQGNKTTAAKLIKYLMREAHWSPFEMVSVTMEIETTRDIARQMLRHRSFSFQEYSQRYADPTKDLEFSEREARLQDTKNRQNSIECNDLNTNCSFQDDQIWLVQKVKELYADALSKGIAKEQARALLPEGLTISRLYMQGTLRSWIHYCQLRMANGTQKEHMIVAKNCWEELRKVFPNVITACEGEE